jgi:hypothetical protein
LSRAATFRAFMLEKRVRSTFKLAVAMLVVTAFGQPAVGAESLSGFPPPRTIQTRSNIFGAVIFWDATPYVERFVARDASPKEALAALEFEAVKIFVEHAPLLARTERHLRLVASVTKTGAINARYQTSTLEGVQTIFTLDGSLRPNMRFPRDWEATAARGTIPAGLKLQVVSDIPAK